MIITQQDISNILAHPTQWPMPHNCKVAPIKYISTEDQLNTRKIQINYGIEISDNAPKYTSFDISNIARNIETWNELKLWLDENIKGPIIVLTETLYIKDNIPDPNMGNIYSFPAIIGLSDEQDICLFALKWSNECS